MRVNTYSIKNYKDKPRSKGQKTKPIQACPERSRMEPIARPRRTPQPGIGLVIAWSTYPAQVTFAEIQELNVGQLYHNNEAFRVNNIKEEIEKVSDLMLKEKSLKVYLQGTASEAPVRFKLAVRFFITVVAQPLK